LLDITWNLAGVPSNVTDVVDLNAEPVIVTLDPTGPADRESSVIVGAAAWAMPGTTTRIIAVVVSTRVFLACLSAMCGLLGRVGEIRIHVGMRDEATAMLTRASGVV
jgi:hypothetical protein